MQQQKQFSIFETIQVDNKGFDSLNQYCTLRSPALYSVAAQYIGIGKEAFVLKESVEGTVVFLSLYKKFPITESVMGNTSSSVQQHTAVTHYTLQPQSSPFSFMP